MLINCKEDDMFHCVIVSVLLESVTSKVTSKLTNSINVLLNVQLNVNIISQHLTVCHIKAKTEHQCEGKEKHCALISFIAVSFPTISNYTITSSD